MRALITGAGGMVGSHMMEELSARGEDVHGTYYRPTIDISELDSSFDLRECDVRYPVSVNRVVSQLKPDVIYHLAAQSYPTVSWERPYETIDTNANGTIAVFEAVKEVRKGSPDYDPMIVVACSSAEYGLTLDRLSGRAAREDDELLPLHPYGVSKVAQDLLAFQYYCNDGIRCIRARIFNSTGTRKVNDVTSDFTRRAIEQELLGADPMVLRVGNTLTSRAIMDVRDLIEALVLLAEKGRPGEAYNISATETITIESIIQLIEKALGVAFERQVDPALLRPTDEKVIIGDTTKLVADTGWKPTIPFEQTVAEMLEYWRRKLG